VTTGSVCVQVYYFWRRTVYNNFFHVGVAEQKRVEHTIADCLNLTRLRVDDEQRLSVYQHPEGCNGQKGLVRYFRVICWCARIGQLCVRIED
jgi:hypothetical protein